MQVVTRALGCIATANVSADDLEPAGQTMPIKSCLQIEATQWHMNADTSGTLSQN